MSQDPMSQERMSRDAMRKDAVSKDAVSLDAASPDATSHDATASTFRSKQEPSSTAAPLPIRPATSALKPAGPTAPGPKMPSPKAPSLESRRAFLSGAAAAASVLAGSTRPLGAASPSPLSERPAAPRPSGPRSAEAQVAASGASARRLNVLFLMSDDMRAELACYGSRFHVHSPNLDRLASQGVRLDRNYCQFPLCNPSRASMFSGRPPHTTRVLGNQVGVMQLHPDWITLPRLFREAGYTTLRNGKLFHAGFDDLSAWVDPCCQAEELHPTASETRVDLPWVEVPRADGSAPPLPGSPGDPENAKAAHSDELLVIAGDGAGSGDDLVVQRTIAALRQCSKTPGRPFFIGAGFSKPHSPPAAPKFCWDLYDEASLPLTPDFAAWPTVPPGFPQAAIRPKNADLFIGRGATPAEARKTIHAYLASISWVDHNVGRVLAELDALGLRDSTVVVFIADHGYQLGEKGKWSKAGSLFEQGTRVPAILHAPGMAGNGRPCTRITESLDIYRTLAELCGLTPGPEIQGQSLVPLLKDPRLATWQKPAFSIWSEDGRTIHGTAVRTERFRYAEFGKDAEHGAMLFDEHADPLELTNLADNPKHAADRAHLASLIAAYGTGDLQPEAGPDDREQKQART